MDDKAYKEYELECDKTRENNSKLLTDFEAHLVSNSLSPKTIKRHVSNIEFYANNYLLRYEIIPIEKGTLQIRGFLGDYFIRKTCWGSSNAIKENIGSFKKFYAYLNKMGYTSNDDFGMMKEIIKEEKEDWFTLSDRF
jgi:site-specific recombinase XerD